MTKSEKYEYLEESNSFFSNIRRNLNIVTINEYVMFLLVGIAILLLSGLIFVLTNTPELLSNTKSGTDIIYYLQPNQNGQVYNSVGLTNQYVVEMFIVAAVIAIGVFGLYLMKNSTAYIDDQNKALQILIIGTTVFLIAALILFFIYLYKETGNFPSFTGLG